MSELQLIRWALERTARRRRLQCAWRGFWQGFLVGAGVWLVALGLYKVFPLPEAVLAWAGAVAGCVMLIGFAGGWLKRETLLETARWVDQKKQFQERISTALEFTSKPSPGRWGDLLIRDAARCIAKVNPRQLLPFSLPAATRWALPILILSAGLGFVPEYRSTEFLQKKRDAEVIRDTGRQLAELTRRSLEQRRPVLEPTRRALDSVAEMGDQLAQANVTRSEALKDLASVTEKLKEQAKELGKNPAFKTMEQAARSPNKGGSPGNAELQKQLESLQKAMGAAKNSDPEALAQFKKDLEKAREAAAGLPDKDSAGGESARDQLAQTLSDLAQKAKEMGLSLPNLEDAISALASSEIDQLVKDLKLAELDLEKLQAMAKAIERLQNMASEAGKDLPEQLKNGQAEVAAGTLEKMVEQLRSGPLSADNLQALIEEVSRAVDPAGNYGQVAEDLKNAESQLRAGKGAAAAGDLEKAAKGLQDLVQQLGDVKSLMASLDSLQKAQMAVANGQGWRASKVPRAGKGGGVGAGVGTWADDSRIMDLNDIKDRWDNSGVVRADEESRGLTDRGDGQLADNLAPTKVKGEINHGAPMPSITLKGVSIKGMSKVDLREMSTAAQREAQSALSQEQIPRAYQNGVKDYFDDLKE